MEAAKIQLSPEELDLVQNAGLLLTKQRIIRKVYDLFGELSAVLQQEIEAKTNLPELVKQISPKISKGENYESLPYVMLDYPRYFSREHVCAIRTFFWWGNFFSVTLQLKGLYMKQYAAMIATEWLMLSSAGFHLAVTTDEWRQDFSAGNFIALSRLGREETSRLLQEHPFCKLSATIPLLEWNNAAQRISTFYAILLKIMKN